MKRTCYIRGGRIVDPVARRDETADLLVVEGRIAPPDTPIPAGTPEINATGLVVAPGFWDLHVHFREPGSGDDETIETGAAAAAAAGFTTVVMMPNTHPPLDTPERVRLVLDRARRVTPIHVLTSACLTRGRQGHDVADIPALAEAGAVAFTDDGSTVADRATMRTAMRAAAATRRPVMDHALDPRLAAGGVIHAGSTAELLGLPGISSTAETTVVDRDISLARETGCAVHIQHVSAAGSVDLIRQAHARGDRVTGEASPHHLCLTDQDIPSDDARFKMNPPLREPADRAALRTAVADGTLGILATDHAPHTTTSKQGGFRNAPFGVIGLETAVGITFTTLVRSGTMSLMEWVARWTAGPARVLAMAPPSFAPGAPADIVLLDLATEWVVDPDAFLSRSRNTPFAGMRITGRAVRTLCNGTPVDTTKEHC